MHFIIVNVQIMYSDKMVNKINKPIKKFWSDFYQFAKQFCDGFKISIVQLIGESVNIFGLVACSKIYLIKSAVQFIRA